MNKFKISSFAKAATIRAVKTMAQTAASLMTVGTTITSMDWKTILGVSFASGVYSLVTSIYTGLPETPELDGKEGEKSDG